MGGMNWAYAMSQGAAAAAGAGADLADQQLKEDADARAADRKLDLQQRMLAAEQAMKNRAAERASAVVKAKMGEEVPQAPKSVTETGLTEGSAKELGLESGIQGDSGVVKDIIKRAQQTIANPSATDEQKQQARELIDQIGGQAKAQGMLNAKDAEGKTRKRTMDEAVEAARPELLANDAPAFIALEGMMKDERAENRADKRAAATVEAARTKAESDERKEEQKTIRNREDNIARGEELERRLEKAFGKSGQQSALVQNLEYLRNTMKWSDEQLNDYITEKKHVSAIDVAAKMLASDKSGELTPAAAAEKAQALIDEIEKKRKPATASTGLDKTDSSPKRLKYNPATGKVE